MTTNVAIRRGPSTDAGTFGRLLLGGNQFCFTLELPWRDNRPQLSCIPPTVYGVAMVRSPHFGRIYHVEDVLGRANVLMHSGDYAGDVTKGFKTHVLGCILLGFRRGVMDGQPALWNSRPAVSAFMRAMGEHPFKLEITQ